MGALLEKLSSNQAPTGVLVSRVGGAADVTIAVGTARAAAVTKSLESDPVPTLKKMDGVALAATPTATLAALLGPLINNAIVGPVVLVGAIFFGFFGDTSRRVVHWDGI